MSSMGIEPRHLRTGMTKKRERNNESQTKVKFKYLKRLNEMFSARIEPQTYSNRKKKMLCVQAIFKEK